MKLVQDFYYLLTDFLSYPLLQRLRLPIYTLKAKTKGKKRKGKIALLWSLHIIVPPMSTIRTKVILDSSNRFSIAIGQEVIRISTSSFLVHAKVCILREMIIVLLKHRYLSHEKQCYELHKI